jgi:FdhD protein
MGGNAAGRTARKRVLRIRLGEGASADHRADLLAVEEPLEIRVDDVPLTVTMRTPGDDIDLAAGFLYTEGLLASLDDVSGIRMCDENVAAVTSRPGSPIHAPNRTFVTTSACGVCGKDSIEAIRVRSRFDLTLDGGTVTPQLLAGLPDQLRQAQRVFASTGGLHAAGLFTAEGELRVRDARLPLAGHVLMVSGRASFELVQKAVMLGVPVLAAVSAPSSLAAELADESGLTLVGFLRGQTMNVYAGAERVTTS